MKEFKINKFITLRLEDVMGAGVFKFRKDHHQVPHSPQGIFQILA